MAQYPRGVRVLKKLQNSNSATLTALDEMVSIMPNNTWLLAQLGEGYAMVRMPNESIQAFEKLRQVDPFRLDNMSTLRIVSMSFLTSVIQNLNLKITKYFVPK